MREKERKRSGEGGRKRGKHAVSCRVYVRACVRENAHPVKSVHCWGRSEMRNGLRSVCYTDTLRYSDFFAEPFFMTMQFVRETYNVDRALLIFLPNAFLHRNYRLIIPFQPIVIV